MGRDLLIMAAGACLVMTSWSGCKKEPKIELRDTEGRIFHAVCPEGGQHCEITPDNPGAGHPSAPKPEGAEAIVVLHQASRFYAVCERWDKAATLSIADCRALVCANDKDCPPAQGLNHGVCTNDLCIEPTGTVTADDAILLCAAGTGAPQGSSKQLERYALGLNCGSPCRVPTVCRQP